MKLLVIISVFLILHFGEEANAHPFGSSMTCNLYCPNDAPCHCQDIYPEDDSDECDDECDDDDDEPIVSPYLPYDTCTDCDVSYPTIAYEYIN